MPHAAAKFVANGQDGRMTSRSATLIGAASIALGIGVTELLAGLLRVRASPVIVVSEAVIDLTPGWIAEPIISLVGTADKPLAIVSVIVAILLLGALVGRLWPAHRIASASLIGALVVLSILAVVSRANSSTLTAVICIVGGLTTAGTLHALHRATPLSAANRGPDAVGEAGPNARPDTDRRAFVRNLALVAGAAVVVTGLGRWAARSRMLVEEARAQLRLPPRSTDVPAGVDLGIDGVPPWSTPPRRFYRIDTALAEPLIEPDEWRLRIHGMVDREITLTYQDLLDRGLSDEWITLCCVSNPVGGDLIGNALWSGVSIKSILDEVGLASGADALLSTSEDGWTCGTPLAALTDGRPALLAVAMDGKPLPIEHGFPVRQVVPGLYGYVSATKWVTDWEVTRFDNFSAYWTERGWGEKGPVKTQSRIDVPTSNPVAGPVKVAGTAWAQHRGIERVEVRVDGGPWNEAELAEVPNVNTWVQWAWSWDATERGDHLLEVRATDGTGQPQTSVQTGVLPDGATGYDALSVTVT